MALQGKFGLMTSIIAIWISAAVIISLHEYFFLANYPGVRQTTEMAEYSFWKNLIAAVAALGFGGLLFSLLEILYFQNRTKRYSFLVTFLSKVSLYLAIMFIIIFGISFFYNSILSGNSIQSVTALQKTFLFIQSAAFWHPVTPFIVLAIISTFLVGIAERLGVKDMWRWITGTYFNAKEEERIFMFLDITDSTTIAEQLGNQKFYELLNDFFQDITNSIVRNKGDIVDYIGDQVIISWTYSDGVKDGKCLRCFEDFIGDIKKRESYYRESYGLVPNFKAAVHGGEVIIGEIGRIKKSIKYSGDVLNTTARVEKICNQIGARLATTENVVALLDTSTFELEHVAPMQLKGKEQILNIYKVNMG